jgi:hypothetical protein
MKTAIWIDDVLLQQADRTAPLPRLSRSRLFAMAVRDFMQRQQEGQMLLRLNEIYKSPPGSAEKRLLRGIKAKVRQTIRERW